MKPQNEIEISCKKLKPIIGKQADQLWHLYLAEDEKARKNTAHDIEVLSEKYLKKEPLENKQILLEPPSRKDSEGRYLLGNIIYNKKELHPLYLKDEDFIKQIGIFAITGHGKTNLAYLLALQLLKSKTPFTVIDWKRSWRNLLSIKDSYTELKNIQVLTVGRNTLPLLWNVFQAPPGTDKDLWIGTISEVLEKSHLSGPGVAYHFNKIFLKLSKDLGDNFYPNFYDGMRELKNTKAVGRELNWKQTAQRIFQSFTLGNASKVFNTRKPVKLESLLNKPLILELDLELPKPLRIFFSEMILRWIHLYRLTQGETDKLRHVLFLEEVHNLFSKNVFDKETNSLENIYREIRGFGQGIVSITQHPSLLPIELLGNCHTQIYLGLQHADDILMARKSLFLNYDEDFYLNILKVGECIVKIKNRIDPCLVKIPFVPVKKEIVTDDWLKMYGLSSLFWEYGWKGKSGEKNFLSLKKNVNDVLFGKGYEAKSENVRNTNFEDDATNEKKDNTPGYYPDQSLQNTSIQTRNPKKNTFKADQKHHANINEKKRKYPPNSWPQHKLLIDILENPFSTITERYRRLKFYPKIGNKYRKELISEECVQPKKIITGTGWITLFEITRKGKMILQDLGFDFKNESEGVVHKFWKYQIAEYYKKQGLDVRIEEYYVNGRPDIIIEKDGKKIAIEIETGKSDYVKNVKRALEAGFDEIVVVGVNRFVEEKIRGELEKRGIDDGRVRVVGVRGFGAEKTL